MSDRPVTPATGKQANPQDLAPPREIKRGQSQWALVWREFRKRRLALLCGWIILALITIAIFAPFLAHDRPLVYHGYNRFEYREAMRTLGVVIGRIADVKTSPSGEVPDEGLADAPVIRLQIDRMARELPPETATELRTLGERIIELGAGPADTKAASALREARVELRREFDIRDVQLQSRWHWPVFASLNWLEIAFLTANVLVLVAVFWRLTAGRISPRLTERLRAPTLVATLCVLPIVAALVWRFGVPDRVDRTQYKRGVFAVEADAFPAAPVVYETVIWPPIPYGLDEDNLDIPYAPPAFFAKAETAEPGESTAAPRPWDQPHWLGTDGIGRDVLSRMIWGGRVSLSVGIVAVSIYVTIGIVVGALAGYFRGWADMLISRLIEIVICFPSFFLILTIVAFLGPSIFNIMIVIGLTGWTGVARLVRGEFLRLGNQDFVLAGRALGYTAPRIIFRHMLPNAMAPVLVSATFGIAGAILTESALSFLGFGITVPTPSWGGILNTGREAIFRAPWMIYVPGLAIFVAITAYNLVGEALRDAADPRLRGRMP